ncbi:MULTISPECIES: hypothetical protein [Pectobacterium]|uniref:hypothetical protein n=1 Tax=Pectobacterium TaxID=122277 RepID=UPI001374A3C7|nr:MULTISPECIES: hypothetical protein [Pectobacterium]
MTFDDTTNETLRHYQALINAHKKEFGLRPLTKAQVIAEMCSYLRHQKTLYLGSTFIRQ